jgi:heme-degrading monooxygenase HmoA
MKTDGNITVEWAPFNTSPEVTENQLLEAAEQFESQFLSQQEGYIRRELLKGKENNWVDLIHWKSEESAAQAFAAASKSEVSGRYFSLMQANENGESGVAHFTQLSHWN